MDRWMSGGIGRCTSCQGQTLRIESTRLVPSVSFDRKEQEIQKEKKKPSQKRQSLEMLSTQTQIVYQTPGVVQGSLSPSLSPALPLSVSSPNNHECPASMVDVRLIYRSPSLRPAPRLFMPIVQHQHQHQNITPSPPSIHITLAFDEVCAHCL